MSLGVLYTLKHVYYGTYQPRYIRQFTNIFSNFNFVHTIQWKIKCILFHIILLNGYT